MKNSSGKTLQAYLFLVPALVLFAAFSFWVGFGSYPALTDHSLIRPAHWVGLDNFRYIFDNGMFVTSLKNSLFFLMSKSDAFPLSVGVPHLVGSYGSSTCVIVAGTVRAVLPMLGVFLLTQRFFMHGMDGAIK